MFCFTWKTCSNIFYNPFELWDMITILQYAVPESIYTNPEEGQWKLQGVGIAKANKLIEYEVIILEFKEGW